jgi:O-antigen/teichoic acid export membrane protein
MKVLPKEASAFAAQFFISILSGSIVFLFLSYASRRFDSGDYSRLSLIIQMLPIYLASLDLGTHNLHILKVSSSKSTAAQKPNSELIVTRVMFALIAFAIALIQAKVARFEMKTIVMTVIFMSCLIPFSIVSSLDTILFAQGREQEAVLLRVARIVGLISAVFVLMLSSEAKVLRIFIVFAGTVWVFVLLIFCYFIRFRNYFTLKSLGQGILSFSVRNNFWPYRETTILYGTIVLFPIFLQMQLIERFGEKNLSDWTSATAIVTPFTIALQTLSQFLARPISRSFRNPENLKEEKSKYYIKFLLITAIILVTYGSIVFLKLNFIAFPHSSELSIPLIFIFAFYQICMLLPSIQVLILQYRGKPLVVLWLFAFSCIPAILLLMFSPFELDLRLFALATLLQGFIYMCGLFLCERFSEKAQQ